MRTGIVTAIVIAILLGSGILAYSLINAKPEARKRKTKITKLGVKAHQEEAATYSLEVDYPARVRAQEEVALGVEVSGKIEKGDIPLKTGQPFKTGDLLFSINNSDITAKLIASKSEFMTTLSRVLPDIQIDFKSEYPKWIAFFDQVSFDKPLPALPKLKSSKEKVYMASKGLVSEYYDINALEILADRHFIRAPFNGAFTSVTKEVGAIATANSQLGKISSTDNLEVVASVTEEDAGKMEIGDQALIKARDSKEFQGKISRISSYLEDKTQMVNVYISLYEPTRAVIEGEMLEVVIPIGEVKDVIKLPFDAVGTNDMVYGIDENNKVYAIQAKLEYVDGEWAYLSDVPNGKLIIQESLLSPVMGVEVHVLSEHID